MKHALAARASRGLTLVELLVAMVIFALVMTLVSQAVSQVVHVVRVADEASQALGGRWARGSAISMALANLVAPVESGERPFVGRPDGIEAMSSQPLGQEDAGVGPVVLRLRTDEGRVGASVMEARLDPTGRGANVWRIIGHFDGRAEFAFRTRAGDWIAQWPPLTARPTSWPEVMPSAMIVRDAGSGRLLMAYPVMASEKVQQPPMTMPFGQSVP